MVRALNPDSRINLQILEKIERNRRNNRDEIKERIRNGDFYKIEFDIPCIKNVNLNRMAKLMGAKDGFTVVKKACNSMKFILEPEDGILDCEAYLTYRGEVFQYCNVELKDVVLNVRGTLSKINPRKTTTIWMEDTMSFDKPRYMLMELKPQKHRCRVVYTQFDNLRNYPNLKVHNDTDILRQIIPDYCFTGYTWKCKHCVHEDTEGLRCIENNDYLLDLEGDTWIDIGNNHKLLDCQNGLIRLSCPDKYLRWKFATD